MSGKSTAFTAFSIQSLLTQARRSGKRIQRMDARDYLGLRFEAFPTGAGSWFYRYRGMDGQYQYEKLGEWPELSLKVAREQRDSLAERIRKGGPRDLITWYRALQALSRSRVR